MLTIYESYNNYNTIDETWLGDHGMVQADKLQPGSDRQRFNAWISEKLLGGDRDLLSKKSKLPLNKPYNKVQTDFNREKALADKSLANKSLANKSQKQPMRPAFGY